MTKTRKPIRVVRANKEDAYFSMARKTAQDVTLSFEARGMLAYLLSKPDDWELQPKDLQQNCGRDKVYKIIQELTKARYIEQSKTYDDKHRIRDYEYKIYEIPYPEKPDTEKPKMDDPHPEKPYPEIPYPENQDSTYKRESQNRESTEIHTDTSDEVSVPQLPKNDSKPAEEKRVPEKPVEPGPPSEEVPNQEPSSSEPSPKVQPHVAIINAWHDGIPDDLRPISGPNIPRNCRAAKAMLEAGIVPEQVAAFMVDQYPSYREWAITNNRPLLMTLEHLLRYIKAWLVKGATKQSGKDAYLLYDDLAVADDCPECHKPKAYCVCGKEAEDDSEDPLLRKCWSAVVGSLRVILPARIQYRLTEVRLLEQRGHAIVLEVRNPIFRNELEYALNNPQLAGLASDLSGGALTTFEVQLKPVTAGLSAAAT